jgi:hypothetical protein
MGRADTQRGRDMTKADEIRLLDKTIKAFGDDSYIGPWLAGVRSQIVADITNDVALPTLDELYTARREAHEIREAAKREADAIRATAHDKAAESLEAARETIRQARAYARQTLERLAGQL